MVQARSAAGLLAGVGLLADGPVVWGRPVPARRPGVYIVELPAPLPKPPIELTKVGKWIERVETLKLDGERPTSKALQARIASFWLPNETVLYVGVSTASIGGRVAGFYETALGDRRPHANGHWLKTFHALDMLRVWWSETSAPEEYEDAILTAFADGFDADARSALPDPSLVLPFANLQTATGDRKRHGITGAVLPDPMAGLASPSRRVVDVAPGDADGTSRAVRGTGTLRKPRQLAVRKPAVRKAAVASPASKPGDTFDMSSESLERMKAEVVEMHGQRPEIVARIKSARELGDLKENAEYHAAREEQGFLEGRIQLLEDRIRKARIIEAPAEDGGKRVRLGSTVVLEHDGETITYTVVGTAESDPPKGRISANSPVGAALLGHDVGEEIDIRTPRGVARYRIVSLG